MTRGVTKGARRGGRPSNDEDVGAQGTLKSANKIDTLIGDIEIASATSLFYLEKGRIVISIRAFP